MLWGSLYGWVNVLLYVRHRGTLEGSRDSSPHSESSLCDLGQPGVIEFQLKQAGQADITRFHLQHYARPSLAERGRCRAEHSSERRRPSRPRQREGDSRMGIAYRGEVAGCK